MKSPQKGYAYGTGKQLFSLLEQGAVPHKLLFRQLLPAPDSALNKWSAITFRVSSGSFAALAKFTV